MDDVLHAALGELDPGYLAVCLIDPAAPGDRQWLAGQWGTIVGGDFNTTHAADISWASAGGQPWHRPNLGDP